MTDIVKVKQSGVQVFPQTHWNAVEGKPETIKGDKGDPGVNATTTSVATTTANGLMSKEDKAKLDGVAKITFEKVGEV